jgi:hypothetical protein
LSILDFSRQESIEPDGHHILETSKGLVLAVNPYIGLFAGGTSLTVGRYRVLKPGGWVQMVEIYFNVQSDNGSISDEHALRQWSSQLMRSMEGIKDFRVGTRLKTLLLAAGFTEVDAKMIPLPLSAWPDSKLPYSGPCACRRVLLTTRQTPQAEV